jgi:hypothetical protein
MSGCGGWKRRVFRLRRSERSRLSGAALTYPSYIQQEKEARARAAARMKERKRAESTVIPRMQQEITRGVDRNRAIAKAREAGATLRAIGDAVDQNGRRSALNGRKASSSGLRGCPWLRTACFVGLLGFSAAGVSVGSGAGAVNSEATGEAGSLDVASADGDSPPETASRRLGAPSLLGSSTAGGGGTTVEGAAAGAIASTTL